MNKDFFVTIITGIETQDSFDKSDADDGSDGNWTDVSLDDCCDKSSQEFFILSS